MNVAHALERLERDQLVRRSEDDDLAFVFKHGLTQETAYTSLLKTQRQRFHYAVASALEEEFPKRREELCHVLAFHWEMGQAPERAHPYYILAAEQAARRFANTEALELYGRALATAGNATSDQLMQMYIKRAEVFEFLSQYAEALKDYDVALGHSRKAGLPEDECHILSRIAWLEWLSGHGDKAVAVAQEAEDKAREVGMPNLALRAYLVRGLVAQAQGDMTEAYPRLRRALASSRKSDARVLEGESLFFLGVQNNFMGRFGRAAACAAKAYEIKASLGDRVGEIVSLYLKARAEAGRGRYDQSLAALEKGLAVSQETGNPFGLAQYPNTRAWLAAELGDWQTAYALDSAGLETAHRAPVRPPEISNLINLVLDCVALGRLDEADRYVMELNQWIGRAEFGFHAWRWQIRFLDARARLLIACSLFDEADRVIHSLEEWAGHTRSTKYIARAMMLHGITSIAQQDWQAAVTSLERARDLADGMQYVPLRIQSRHTLAHLYARLDDKDRAARTHTESERLLQEVDRCIERPELKQMFLAGAGKQETQKG